MKSLICPTMSVIRRIVFSALWVLMASVAFAQSETIHFTKKEMNIGQAMTEIKQQTRFKFIYNAAELNTACRVNLDTSGIHIKRAMDMITAKSNTTYFFRNNYIVIGQTQEATPTRTSTETLSRSDNHTLLDNHTNPQNKTTAASYEHLTQQEQQMRGVPVIVPGVIKSGAVSHSNIKLPEYHNTFYWKPPLWGIKVNLLYGGVALTPNLAVEFGMGKKQTFEASGSYSWRGRKKAASDHHKQSAHWLVRAEYRRWFCERFNGHYLGAHLLYSRYYISNHNVPLLFDKAYSYDGHAYGAGVTYGYHLAIGKRWGLEFNIGAGYVYLKYDKGNCVKCYSDNEASNKHYFGPTRAGINLVFMVK